MNETETETTTYEDFKAADITNRILNDAVVKASEEWVEARAHAARLAEHAPSDSLTAQRARVAARASDAHRKAVSILIAIAHAARRTKP